MCGTGSSQSTCGDVEPSAGDVSGDEDAAGHALEPVQGLHALSLGHDGVQRHAVHVHVAQDRRRLLAAAAGAHEDHGGVALQAVRRPCNESSEYQID
jgi:hypothetical protein